MQGYYRPTFSDKHDFENKLERLARDVKLMVQNSGLLDRSKLLLFELLSKPI